MAINAGFFQFCRWDETQREFSTLSPSLRSVHRQRSPAKMTERIHQAYRCSSAQFFVCRLVEEQCHFLNHVFDFLRLVQAIVFWGLECCLFNRVSNVEIYQENLQSALGLPTPTIQLHIQRP